MKHFHFFLFYFLRRLITSYIFGSCELVYESAHIYEQLCEVSYYLSSLSTSDTVFFDQCSTGSSLNYFYEALRKVILVTDL